MYFKGEIMSKEEKEEEEDEEDELELEIKADVLKKLVADVTSLVDEVIVDFEKDGINIDAMDAAHVGMINLTLDEDAFESYNSNGVTLGINMSRIDDYLKLVEKDGNVKIELIDDDKIMLESDDLRHKMKLLDTSDLSSKSLPDIDYDNEISLLSKHIKRGVRASSNISDHIRVRVNEDDEIMYLYTEEQEDEIELTIDKSKWDSHDLDDDTDGNYANDYFKNMMDCVSNSQVVTISSKNDYPIKIEYEFDEGNGNIIFLLAPRVSAKK